MDGLLSYELCWTFGKSFTSICGLHNEGTLAFMLSLERTETETNWIRLANTIYDPASSHDSQV